MHAKATSLEVHVWQDEELAALRARMLRRQPFAACSSPPVFRWLDA